MTLLSEALAPHPGKYRFYPLTTGQGDIQAAAIRRRIFIEHPPQVLRPRSLPPYCNAIRS
jgi:hypothetical protein